MAVRLPASTILRRADAALGVATDRVRLLGALTPTNAAAERARLQAALEAGSAVLPRWEYAALDHGDLRRALDTLAGELDRCGDPLLAAYAARARELELEARIAELAGASRLGAAARARYPAPDEEDATTAAEWLATIPAATARAHVRSDDEGDPRSLVARLRAEIGLRRLPFTVSVDARISALAVTTASSVLVAARRMVSIEDVERTVTHEIEAHVVPRARARSSAVALLRLGTAGGFDDQEGYAVLLEERHGHLTPARKRELALRSRGAARMCAGADFVELTRALIADGLTFEQALSLAERLFRGSDGRSEGLGRERIYLARHRAVSAHLARHPDDERVLASGIVSLSATATLAAYYDPPG